MTSCQQIRTSIPFPQIQDHPEVYLQTNRPQILIFTNIIFRKRSVKHLYNAGIKILKIRSFLTENTDLRGKPVL